MIQARSSLMWYGSPPVKKMDSLLLLIDFYAKFFELATIFYAKTTKTSICAPLGI